MSRDKTTDKGFERFRTFRQDVCFLVSVLLLLAVIATALTSLAGDEFEAFGFGDDLHAVAGWSLVVLAFAHVLMHARQLVRYAKRRVRGLLGIGAVTATGYEGALDEGGQDAPYRAERRGRVDRT